MDVREKLFTLFQDCNNPSWKWFPNNAEMLKLIDYLIAHGVTVQEWISVKDRLPDFFGTFLVVVEEDDPDNTLYTDCADYDPFEKSWRTFGYFDNGSRIKLWMPLPQPPKGE